MRLGAEPEATLLGTLEGTLAAAMAAGVAAAAVAAAGAAEVSEPSRRASRARTSPTSGASGVRRPDITRRSAARRLRCRHLDWRTTPRRLDHLGALTSPQLRGGDFGRPPAAGP
eukprot:253039-Chlamydomonas_euryale.AAC.1